jgi:hypothetical protein
VNNVDSLTQSTPAGDVLDIESLIQLGPSSLSDARTALRHLLFIQGKEDETNGSIGDALAALARQPVKSPIAAIVLMRCLAVDGLVPKDNSSNQISRSTAELCEGAIPEIMAFLKMEARTQNYQKFAVILTGHQRVTEILNPLCYSYGDIDAIIAARKSILGSLNHSIVRQYCSLFRLNEMRSTIEIVFSKISKIYKLDDTLLSDIEDYEMCVNNATAEYTEAKTFLTKEYLEPFLSTCQSVSSQFLLAQRVRFKTTVLWGRGSTPQLQKRYLLHEAERNTQIAVPLRNSGPGLATDVRVSVTSESADVLLGSETAMLGNVLPGDFSTMIHATVLTPTESFRGLMQVDWGEIGSSLRNSEMFEFEVIAQRSDIEWQKLQYIAPYNTGVAEGDQFYGRKDKVQQLAARLLRQPMEPFFITGQKRVGKTSLALAAASYAVSISPANTLSYHYILWGAIAHSDANVSLRQLGESVEEFIFDRFPADTNPQKGDYNGSLAALVKLSTLAKRVVPDARFVVIVDEFDEIHEDLFIRGSLAETFFANLRALSRLSNICIILVGGENMPFIMDRQGQKLNNFFKGKSKLLFARNGVGRFSTISPGADERGHQLARRRSFRSVQYYPRQSILCKNRLR